MTMTTTTLQHRHGGTITAIHSIAHDTDAGCPIWFFIGDVKWDDGGTSTNQEIAPHVIVCEPSDPTAKALFAALDKYLDDEGERLREPKRLRDGRLSWWTPRARKGTRAIDADALTPAK